MSTTLVEQQQPGTLQIYDLPPNTTTAPVCGDTLALSTEEAFTVETLGQLIRTYKRQNKTLILARVETVEGRKFYYSAHQLNKVIFRRSGERGEYLFRLYALNPLTNTEIIGDVRYYAVESVVEKEKERDRETEDPEAKGRRFLSTAGSRRVSTAEARRSSMSTLMRNSLGSARSSIRVAEVAGPVGADLQRIANAATRGSGELNVEITSASRGDLAIIEVLERQRLERERKVEQEALTKKLKQQLKDRRDKVKSKGDLAGRDEETGLGPTTLRSASLEDMKLSEKDVRVASAPDLSRMGSHASDMISTENLHTSLSITSLALADVQDEKSQQCIDPQQDITKAQHRQLQRITGSDRRRSASTPDALNGSQTLPIPGNRLDVRRLSSPHQLNTFLEQAVKDAHEQHPLDSSTFKVKLRPKAIDTSVNKTDDRPPSNAAISALPPRPRSAAASTSHIPGSPAMQPRRKSALASSSVDALGRSSASRKVEFVPTQPIPARSTDPEPAMQRTESEVIDADIEGLKAELKKTKSISHESVVQDEQPKGWRLAARKLSASLGHGLDHIIRPRSLSQIHRDSQHSVHIGDSRRGSKGHRKSKSGKGAWSSSAADLQEVYKAVFIGTDDDFLQRACVRKMFELNALEAGDAALFDMPGDVLANEGIDINGPAAMMARYLT